MYRWTATAYQKALALSFCKTLVEWGLFVEEKQMRLKVMVHDKCGGVVVHKTRKCRKCGKMPAGSEVTLVRRQQ